jgi:hypothetical protein
MNDVLMYNSYTCLLILMILKSTLHTDCTSIISYVIARLLLFLACFLRSLFQNFHPFTQPARARLALHHISTCQEMNPDFCCPCHKAFSTKFAFALSRFFANPSLLPNCIPFSFNSKFCTSTTKWLTPYASFIWERLLVRQRYN